MSELVNRKGRLKSGSIVFYIFNYSFYILFALLCLFPFYYLLINTISDNSLVSSGKISFIPRNLHFKNYINVLSGESALVKAFIVTVTRSIFGTALMVMASAFVGYLLTKKEMWGHKYLYRILVITMYFNVGVIPLVMTMQMLGLTNNYMVYILPGIVSPYNIILVKNYIESLPSELEELAVIDGASYWKIFIKIVWPICKPILITVAVFGFVENWNAFLDSLIYMQSAQDLFTLPHFLWNYMNKPSSFLPSMTMGAGSANEIARQALSNQKILKYTVAMITAIPILIVFPIMAKHFEKGIALGTEKKLD